MTSGLQPPSSGAPTPVQGVTGGPAVLGGQISNDPGTGNVVVAPNPGQVLQVRKGSNPTALQVYEYFHTNTDYSRIALNSQTNGPFQLAVETAPSTVIRALDIHANGGITNNGHAFSIPHLAVGDGTSPTTASSTATLLQGMTVTFTPTSTCNVFITFMGNFSNTVTNALASVNCYMDGSVMTGGGIYIAQSFAAGGLVVTSFSTGFQGLTPVSHTFQILWTTNAGTLTCNSTRTFVVTEMY